MQKTTQDLLLRLRKIKDQQLLSYAKIAEMIEANGDSISETTLRRVMTEDRNYRYFETLQPIAKALLKLDEVEEGVTDEEQATKDVALIKDMEYKLLLEKCKKYEERVKYLEERVEYLKDQVAVHQAAIERKDEQLAAKDAQIASRDKSIQKRDEVIERFSKCTLTFLEAIKKEEAPDCTE